MHNVLVIRLVKNAKEKNVVRWTDHLDMTVAVPVDLKQSKKNLTIQAAVGHVVQKFQDVDPDLWCKILYIEYDKNVAKFYICVMMKLS